MSKIRTLCVYCGSSSNVAPAFQDAARAMGRLMGEAGIDLVYGGGRVGLMGLVADSALEAGSRVTGIIPEHIQEREVRHNDLDELLIVDSMHTRKRMMVERSDGFIVLPGGLGTLDETFEILTWRQLGLHDKPVILVNIEGYWDLALELIDHLIEKGFARPQNRDLLTVVDSPLAALDALALAPEPRMRPQVETI